MADNETPNTFEINLITDEEKAAEFILEAEEIIKAIKKGEIDGEYFEF